MALNFDPLAYMRFVVLLSPVILPVMAIFGLILKYCFQNLLITLTLSIIFDLVIFIGTYFSGSCVVIGLTDNFLL